MCWTGGHQVLLIMLSGKERLCRHGASERVIVVRFASAKVYKFNFHA